MVLVSQRGRKKLKSADGFKDWGLWDQFIAQQLAYFAKRLKETATFMNAAMIIAHPDDDALFGGPFQRAHRWMKWHVICVTHESADGRGRELIEWQAKNNCQRVDFLEFRDRPADLSSGTSSFAPEEVVDRLRHLDLNTDLILTHNELGEYGHPHHIVVGQAVRSVYAGTVPILEFGHSLTDTDFRIVVPDFHELAIQCYRSQTDCILYHHSRDELCISADYRWTRTRP